MIETKDKRISLGVFQGRLTPRGQRTIQFFPFENWENEFPAAKKLGLDEIEFIFDFEHFEENPLWSKTGIKKIKNLIRKNSVAVNHICADFFMASPFFRVSPEVRKDNMAVLKRLIKTAAEIGAGNIEIPILDNSSIKTSAEENILVETIGEVIPEAKAAGVTLGLETDLPPDKFLSLLQKFGSETIKANYDSGNSAGLGFDHLEEITTLARHIGNVHIKDRLFHGTTVPLGTGNADFEKFFGALKKIGYRGSIILQAARGEDGREAETVTKYIDFVNGFIKRYLSE